jgi:tetratricopeptide (TPR) repeat protein
MLNRRYTWAVVVAVILASGAALLLIPRSTREVSSTDDPAPRAAPPPLQAYPALPPAFAEALNAAHARATAALEGDKFGRAGKPSGYERERVGGPADTAEAVRHLARLYQANRLDAEARACYEVLGNIAPGLSPQDHYNLAEIALNAGDLPAAAQTLRTAVQGAPEYLPARLALAEVLFKTGEEEAAAKEYAAILQKESSHPQAALGLARVELQQGEEDRAVKRLDALVSAHPEMRSAAALLAQVLRRRGDTERAQALTQSKRLQADPVPPDPWLRDLLVDCYDVQRLTLKFEELLFSGQLEEGVPLLDRVEKLAPQSWIPAMMRGFSQAGARHFAEAVDAYRDALARGADPEKIGPLMVPPLMALGRTADAQALITQWRVRSPNSVSLLGLDADVALRAGNNERARQLLVELLAQEPYVYTANMNLAKILWQQDRATAVECLQRIVKVFPVDVASRGLLGQHFLEHGDPASAIPPLEQALVPAGEGTPAQAKLSAMLRTAYRQAGDNAAGGGRPADALGFYEKLAALSPTDLEALAAVANLATQQKDFSRAAQTLQKMKALAPQNPTIALSLGDVWCQAGDMRRAREEWQSARAVAPAADRDLLDALEQRLSGKITQESFR